MANGQEMEDKLRTVSSHPGFHRERASGELILMSSLGFYYILSRHRELPIIRCGRYGKFLCGKPSVGKYPAFIPTSPAPSLSHTSFIPHLTTEGRDRVGCEKKVCGEVSESHAIPSKPVPSINIFAFQGWERGLTWC